VSNVVFELFLYFLLSLYTAEQLPSLQCALLTCPRHAPVACQCRGCSFISVEEGSFVDVTDILFRSI